jgi:hypothetical protein
VVGCGADGLGDDRLDDAVGCVGVALVAPGDPGAGKNGARNRLWPSGLLNTCKGVIVTITDRMAAWRRERRVLQRVSAFPATLPGAPHWLSWTALKGQISPESPRTQSTRRPDAASTQSGNG